MSKVQIFFSGAVGLFLTFSIAVQAQSLTLPTAQNYQSGRQIYQAQLQLIEFEHGFFTKVPLDHDHPADGDFEIYSWFADPFDPTLPTVVYLTGGPGQSSHWGQSALVSKTHNLLLVDQRGIALSRPPLLSQYLNPKFYSSVAIAKDLEVLRKSLKIAKWSVYGVSFGTVPATIYASLFPQSTVSVILEGTAFSVNQIWGFEGKKKLITAAIGAQTADVQSQIQQILSNPEIQSRWFFQWARDTLLMNEGRQTMTEQLASLKEPAARTDFLQQLKTQYGPQAPIEPNVLFALNDVPYYMISCQELGLAKSNTMTDLQWVQGQIVTTRNSKIDSICASIHATAARDYLASQYPVQVPITYFQGQNDPATEYSGAYQHFQQVPKGLKQMLLMPEGGHNPNLQMLGLDIPEQQAMIEKAFRGEMIPADLVQKAGQALTGLSWLFLSK